MIANESERLQKLMNINHKNLIIIKTFFTPPLTALLEMCFIEILFQNYCRDFLFGSMIWYCYVHSISTLILLLLNYGFFTTLIRIIHQEKGNYI